MFSEKRFYLLSRDITFFKLLSEQVNRNLPYHFFWITSARLPLEEKRKIQKYLVNGKT